MKEVVKWSRRGKGYETSSVGDLRCSAFFAKLEDGRSIEVHFQCDVNNMTQVELTGN